MTSFENDPVAIKAKIQEHRHAIDVLKGTLAAPPKGITANSIKRVHQQVFDHEYHIADLEHMLQVCELRAQAAQTPAKHGLSNSDPARELYPLEFSAQARARVEAENLKARKLYDEQRQNVPWSKFGPSRADEENLRRYILRVFHVFTQEACKLGSQGELTIEQIRSSADEYLRLFTIEVYYHEGYDKNVRKLREMTSHMNGSILPEVEREFRRSDEWHQFEGELLTVAEKIAKGSVQKNETRSEDGSGTTRAMIEAFMTKMAESGRKITRKNIWTVAGYKDRTEFQRFQSGSPRTTQSATLSFNRVLKMKPEDFIQTLNDKSSR
jgi:hypothetical protein